MTTANEAYDRLHGADRHTQAEPCPACGGSMRFCECMDDPFAPAAGRECRTCGCGTDGDGDCPCGCIDPGAPAQAQPLGQRNTVSYPGDCGAHFGGHPTMTHLVGVCTRPEGHDGEHSNVLHKPGQDPDRRR